MLFRSTILQIIPRLDTGGAELSTVEIVEAVMRAGGRALVATEGGRLAGRIAAAGGEIVPFPAATKNPFRVAANAHTLRHLIARERVDLIHARSRAPAWSGLFAARGARIPFVTTYHGAYAEQGPLKRFYNGVMARSDLVIANSAYTAGLIRDRYGTPESRIRVIHRGVDLARFDPELVAGIRVEALRRHWAATAGEPIILQAARLTGWKGQGVLIEALGLLRDQGGLGRAVLVLAGDAQGRDGFRERLRQQAQGLGLGDRVRLPGHVEDIPAAYLAARLTVVASTEPEAFGRAVTEAAAMGCPVISTDIGAPPETILSLPRVSADQATGWLVPPGDARALAQRIGTALAMPDTERSRMGERARSHIAQRFTVAAMQRRTLAVYDEVLRTQLERAFAEATIGGPASTGGPTAA